MSETTTTDGTSTDEELYTTECGHERPRSETVSVPGVGMLCREHHTPYPIEQWESTIDTSRVHHHTGETTRYETWLVGLDPVGRAVYHDERRRRLLVVVPKYHYAFRQDVSLDQRPIRKTPAKHSPSQGALADSPDGGVLVTHTIIDTRSDEFRKRDLSEIIVERATDESAGWTALSERALNTLESLVDKYDVDHYSDDVFPVAEARDVLQEHRDAAEAE